MSFRFFILLCWCTILGIGCTTSRKISQVGLREPSSLRSIEAKDEISPARIRLANLQDAPATCPQNFSSVIAQLSVQKIIQPRCPESFSVNVQSSLNSLLMEERSMLEEVEGAQCQSLIRAQQEDALLNFLDGFETSGPVGRHRHIMESIRSQQVNFESLGRLKENLREIIRINFPVERWIMRHGKFALPENDLSFLYSLINRQACKLNDADFESLYSLQQNIEELARIVVQEKQREDLLLFLENLHLITDSKVKEFFYPK